MKLDRRPSPLREARPPARPVPKAIPIWVTVTVVVGWVGIYLLAAAIDGSVVTQVQP